MNKIWHRALLFFSLALIYTRTLTDSKGTCLEENMFLEILEGLRDQY